MKKFEHPIDDLFRDALEDHRMTPSDAAKKAFLKDAGLLPPPVKKGGRPLILLSALLLLAGAGIIIWAVTRDKFVPASGISGQSSVENTPATAVKTGSTGKPDIQNHTQPEPSGEGINKQIKIVPASHAPRSKSTIQTTFSQVKINTLSGTEITQINEQPELTASQEQSSQLRPQTQANPSATGKPEEPEVQVAMAVVSTSAINSPETPGSTAAGTNDKTPDNLAVNVNPPVISPSDTSLQLPDTNLKVRMNDSIVNPATGNNEKKPEKYRKPAGWIPTLGVYYAPEWMFNTLEGNKFVNNFGLEGTFHFGQFSIRTGAGLSVAQGTHELVVEYNEFLGAYNKLDSMDFTWNVPTNDYIPKFYMSNQDVWDSLMKLDYARVVKRYTYLQVPMILGYDFWQSERISVGVRMGPVMSVLLASKQLSADYDPGMKRIISINDIAPGQVSLNWQVTGGINTAFRLTDNLYFEVEPWIKYYFNSVYEKPANNTKPWSVGVRAAFNIKF